VLDIHLSLLIYIETCSAVNCHECLLGSLCAYDGTCRKINTPTSTCSKPASSSLLASDKQSTAVWPSPFVKLQLALLRSPGRYGHETVRLYPYPCARHLVCF
jgi:hypothetical protein